MIRILGIDPGSQRTGIGIIDADSNGASHFIHCETLSLLKAESFPERLGLLAEALDRIIVEHRPQQVAVETVFMAKGAQSALKLGQARGAALATVVRAGLPVHEYAPRLIKQSLVGTGAAEKTQVQMMVATLLRLEGRIQADAADALAVALTHAHGNAHATTRQLPPDWRGRRRGRR